MRRPATVSQRLCAKACRAAPALAVAVIGFPASATETHWTGGAGPAHPYWDLAANWSAGGPASPSTVARLGKFDTTMRGGVFDAESVTGTGNFTMLGGALSFAGGKSRFGGLDLQGGAFLGTSDIGTQTLRWVGGNFVPPICCMNISVARQAVLGGDVTLGITTTVRLHGETSWLDGPSAIYNEDYGLVSGSWFINGQFGRFTDHADSARHALSVNEIVNRGTWTKTGRDATRHQFLRFLNDGQLTVSGGTLTHASHDGYVVNRGSMVIDGGSYDYFINGYGKFTNDGAIAITQGSMDLGLGSPKNALESRGDWNIGQGGRLTVTGFYGLGGSMPASHFASGQLRNDGILRLGTTAAAFTGDSELSGTGTVELRDAATLSLARPTSIGTLVIAGSTEPLVRDGVSEVLAAGGLTLDRLHWGTGRLAASGPVVVNGRADLVEDQVDRLLPWPGKQMDSRFAFLGETRWDGRSDIFGAGDLAIGSNGVFHDEGAGAMARIDVANVVNAGVYRKGAAGNTVVGSAFMNQGAIVARDSGTMTFAGALDNRGTIESIRSRVELFGPLAQAGDKGLTGGRFVMRDGAIVLNLGGDRQPNLIELNGADITLDGPKAAMAVTWLGSDHDALSALRSNTGRIALSGGAALTVNSPTVTNHRQVAIGTGSTFALRTAAATYAQDFDPDDSATTANTSVDGTLQADHMIFEGGSLTAGAIGVTGQGRLLAKDISVVGIGALWVDVDKTSFDRLAAPGATVNLSGVLVGVFDDKLTAPAGYRILTGAHAINGQFADVHTNLNATEYRVWATYGDHAVQLRVAPVAIAAAVPELPSAALLMTGLALAGAAARSRQRMQSA